MLAKIPRRSLIQTKKPTRLNSKTIATKCSRCGVGGARAKNECERRGAWLVAAG